MSKTQTIFVVIFVDLILRTSFSTTIFSIQTIMFIMYALNTIDVTQISRRHAFPGIRVMIHQ